MFLLKKMIYFFSIMMLMSQGLGSYQEPYSGIPIEKTIREAELLTNESKFVSETIKVNEESNLRTSISTKEVKVLLDDSFIEYNNDLGFPFIDANSRTQVPLRATMETFGAEVTWDEVNFVATVTKDNTKVEVPIGERFVYVNDVPFENDTEAIIIESRTYIPIRIVLEAFGAQVLWDNENYHVIIHTYEIKDALLSLPRMFDSRILDKQTSVKNQGSLGTCWAFATLAAIESRLLPEEKWSFSADHLSLQHGFNLGQSDGGEFNMSLAYLTRWAGPVKEEDDAYGDGVSPANLKAVKHLQEAMILPSKNYTEIKKAVYLYGAVQTSVYSPIQDRALNTNYYNTATHALNVYNDKKPNHDVIIVGWDDDYPKENFLVEPEGNGAFICKNSWGDGYGLDGYYYISYYDYNVGTNNIVYTRVDDPNNYDNIYLTDILGWVGNLGYNAETAYFSNVYTTKKNEALRAVGFYATGDASTYEVYVVKEFKDVESFKNMELLDKGELKFAGYYTIDFNQEILLEANETFAVVVKITTPGSSYPVAIEFNAGNYTADFVLEDGRGYISHNGKNWENTELSQKSNVSLKAYTDNWIE